MEETLTARAARQFGDAADALVDGCRMLEQCGIDDEPVERLLLALEDVTRIVHQMHPPEARLQTEPADIARPGCYLR
jgi:cation transport regulator ChaC